MFFCLKTIFLACQIVTQWYHHHTIQQRSAMSTYIFFFQLWKYHFNFVWSSIWNWDPIFNLTNYQPMFLVYDEITAHFRWLILSQTCSQSKHVEFSQLNNCHICLKACKLQHQSVLFSVFCKFCICGEFPTVLLARIHFGPMSSPSSIPVS